jgi:hypothetical protein
LCNSAKKGRSSKTSHLPIYISDFVTHVVTIDSPAARYPVGKVKKEFALPAYNPRKCLSAELEKNKEKWATIGFSCISTIYVVTEKTPQHFAGENSISSDKTKLKVSDAHRQGHLSVNTKTGKKLHIDLKLWLNIKNQNPYVPILLSLHHFKRKTSHPVPREGETLHSSKTLLPPTLPCFTIHIIVVERQGDHT